MIILWEADVSDGIIVTGVEELDRQVTGVNLVHLSCGCAYKELLIQKLMKMCVVIAAVYRAPDFHCPSETVM